MYWSAPRTAQCDCGITKHAVSVQCATTMCRSYQGLTYSVMNISTVAAVACRQNCISAATVELQMAQLMYRAARAEYTSHLLIRKHMCSLTLQKTNINLQGTKHNRDGYVGLSARLPQKRRAKNQDKVQSCLCPH